MPEGAVYVGRPTKWGNPWVVRAVVDGCVVDGWRLYLNDRPLCASSDRDELLAAAVEAHSEWIERLLRHHPDELDELAGRDLACWCPLDQPCHVDTLLRLANGGVR